MTSRDFRRIALGLERAEERSHGGHPDFRVNGRIFATLGYPAPGWGVIVLTALQQQMVLEGDPPGLQPVKGTWGAKGSTSVRLKDARVADVREALTLAWKNRALKSRPR